MSSALSSPRYDLDLEAPARSPRRGPRREGGAPAARGASAGRAGAARRTRIRPLRWLLARLRNRPGSTLAHVVFAALALVVGINAIWLQPPGGRSAAEWLGATAPRAPVPSSPAPSPAPAARVATPAPAALPPGRPPELRGTPAASTQAAPAPTATARATPAPSAAPSAAPQAALDPLGELIRSGQIAAPRPPAEVRGEARIEPARLAAGPVLPAQRALERLGYGPIRADGVFGEQTRAALERFERDRKLPVTRDLSPRTLRELASASGVRME